MRRYLFAGALLTTIGVSATASAQYNNQQLDVRPSGISIKGGGFFPVDNNLRGISKSFFGLGFEYEFPQQYAKNSQTFFSFEWFAHSLNGRQNNVFPITINQRFGLNTGDRKDYWFVGVGPTVINAGNSKTVIGGRAGIGTQFSQSFFGEVVGYISGADDNGNHANGVGVFFGYRF